MLLGTALMFTTVATVGGVAVLIGAGFLFYKMVYRIIEQQEF